MAVITMRQMLEAGVHFGHQTRRWNPKMKRFIFGERNGIYIIDLEQTLTRVETAYNFVRDLVAGGGIVLFVGTKKQAQDPVRSYAEKCGMPYVNERWLGGMLTNFETISKRVGKMLEYERMQRLRRVRRDAEEGSPAARPRAGEAAAQPRRHPRHEQAPRRGLRARHQEGAHRRHRGQQAGHPGGRRRRHQRRPRRRAVPDPGQRRRHPRQRAAGPRHRRGRRGGPLHRRQAQPAGSAAVVRTAEEEAAFAARQAEARNARPPRPRPSATPASPPPAPATPAAEPAEAPAQEPSAEPDVAADADAAAADAATAEIAADVALDAEPASSPPTSRLDRCRRRRRPGRHHRRRATERAESSDGVHRQGRTGAAPGHRRRDDGCQEGPRGQRRRHGGRQAVAAREGPRRQRQARRPREHPGRRGARRSTATSARSSS